MAREDHLDQMESPVRWEPPVQAEFSASLVIWDLWERWAFQDQMD